MRFTPQLMRHMLLMPHLIVVHTVFLIAALVAFQDHAAPLVVLLDEVVLVVDFIATHVVVLEAVHDLIRVSLRMDELNQQLALEALMAAILNHRQMVESSLDHHSENQKPIVQCHQMYEIERLKLPNSM